MKVFYVIDENGEFYSEDRKVRYKELRGKALKEYLSSVEGRGKYFCTDVDEFGNIYGVEIPEKHKADYRSEKRHMEYIDEERKQYIMVSLEMNIGEEIGETLESYISDEETEDIFETISKRELIGSLRKILPSLDKEEYEILNSLILSDDRMTLREYAEYLEVHFTTVDYRLKEILKKIEKIFPTS